MVLNHRFCSFTTTNKLVNEAANDSALVSGQDRKILPAFGTNQIAGFRGFRPLASSEKYNVLQLTTKLKEQKWFNSLLAFTKVKVNIAPSGITRDEKKLLSRSLQKRFFLDSGYHINQFAWQAFAAKGVEFSFCFMIITYLDSILNAVTLIGANKHSEKWSQGKFPSHLGKVIDHTP